MGRRSTGRTFLRGCFGLLGAAWMSGAVCSSLAQAQALREGASTAGKSTEAELGPRGQHMPRNIQYGAWRKLCFKQADAKILCRTSSSGTWDIGQMAVRVDLVERRDGEARLQIFLPVGLYLQPGVKISVDGGSPLQVPYSWCLTNICVAGTRVSPHQIREIESGRKLTLEVVDANIQTVATSLPLDGFGSAHSGPAAETFDYQLNDNE